uniref:ATP synthase protein 8 n=1 Tax=Groenewaldozyma salmanticensis TaxID=49332 RepID=E5L093_9ASCO|nr:ATP synthase F0 subunit 8 [Groenewaldozyma salmanticensis]ADO51058.1 ATP synthase F0 subunit 8 [Groenewaldozyma salmanticensis]
MPQLEPFYFVHLLVWGFINLLIIIYLNTKYILPRILYIYLSRILISKL